MKFGDGFWFLEKTFLFIGRAYVTPLS